MFQETKNIQLFVISALRVDTCEVRTFMKCMHTCVAQKAYYLFTKL